MKHDAKRRAAVHEAGSHAVYAGLHTLTPEFQALLSDQHRVAGLLAGYAAEAVHGFGVDLDAALEEARQRAHTAASDDLTRAYRVALHLVRPAERALGEERRHQAAARHIREIWTKTVAYLSRPNVERMTSKLADLASRGDALSIGTTRRLISSAPDFDASVTQRIESYRIARDAEMARAVRAERALLRRDRQRLEAAP